MGWSNYEWVCPYSGKIFEPQELIGYGNPPRSPGCPVGDGHGAPMTPVALGTKAANAASAEPTTQAKKQ